MPFKFDTCGAQFTCRSYLKTDMCVHTKRGMTCDMMHTSQVPYERDTCCVGGGGGCTLHSMIKSYSHTNAFTLEKKPYKCDISYVWLVNETWTYTLARKRLLWHVNNSALPVWGISILRAARLGISKSAHFSKWAMRMLPIRCCPILEVRCVFWEFIERAP